MEISVSGRHFTITEDVKRKAVEAVESRFSELPLKIISAQVVLDRQGNLCTASVVVNIKELTARAEVQDFEIAKAIEDAAEKAVIQARKYLDKKQHHKNGETLVKLEQKNAEKNQQ